MQDLNVINRQNAQACIDHDVATSRAAGKTVVLEKDGLHVTGFKAFETVAEAEAHAKAHDATSPSAHHLVLAPTSERNAAFGVQNV